MHAVTWILLLVALQQKNYYYHPCHALMEPETGRERPPPPPPTTSTGQDKLVSPVVDIRPLRSASPTAAAVGSPDHRPAHSVQPPPTSPVVDIQQVRDSHDWGDNFNVCSWSEVGKPYPAPFWNEHQGKVMSQFVQLLNDHGVVHRLLAGSLLGAYRGGGPIPCDGDMDIVFPVWLNGLAECREGARYIPELKGVGEWQATLCSKTRADYVHVASEFFSNTLRRASVLRTTGFGASTGSASTWSCPCGGNGRGHLCRCKFGETTHALCLENTGQSSGTSTVRVSWRHTTRSG